MASVKQDMTQDRPQVPGILCKGADEAGRYLAGLLQGVLKAAHVGLQRSQVTVRFFTIDPLQLQVGRC